MCCPPLVSPRLIRVRVRRRLEGWPAKAEARNVVAAPATQGESPAQAAVMPPEPPVLKRESGSEKAVCLKTSRKGNHPVRHFRARLLGISTLLAGLATLLV